MLMRQNFNLSSPTSSSFFFIFLLLHNFYYFPSSILISFSSTIFSIFSPQSWFPSSSSSTSSVILYIFPSTNTSTPDRPHIDPTSTQDSIFSFNTASWILKLYIQSPPHLFFPLPPPPIVFLPDRLFEFGLRLAFFWPVSGLWPSK